MKNEIEDLNFREEQIAKTLRLWGYEKLCFAGQGAFSQVYRVKKSDTEGWCACKVSAKQEILQRESTILQQLDHPLFPKFLDYKKQGGLAFLFMEYVPGMGLETMVERRGHLSECQTIRIATALAEGIKYLHELDEPILFRDLKPENIRICENGRVKLLDMGSAGSVSDLKYVITGTPGYAAPEQWKESGALGFYSDVYALGQVMLFMLTGRKTNTFYVETDKMCLDLRKVHRGVTQLIEDCLVGEKEERIPDMRCFLHRLAPYRHGRKKALLCAEIRVLLRRRRQKGYVFYQNILK